jgi:DNA-binding FadR family transcriptional regulator
MIHNKRKQLQLSELLSYLTLIKGENDRIPPLQELSSELNLSVASLREQLAVARAIGVIEARPRTGLKKLPYSFAPAIRESASYAISSDIKYFEMYADLRRHIEASYWLQAVQLLTPDDIARMDELVKQAFAKLLGKPIQIPHREHRKLHMLTFSHVGNEFVLGILEAYWDLYEAVGLDRYTDYNYLEEVWHYHQSIVDAIRNGNFEEGYKTMSIHMDLIVQREKQPSGSRQKFE